MDLEAFAEVLAEVEEAAARGELTSTRYTELRDRAREVASDEWDELVEAVENFAP